MATRRAAGAVILGIVGTAVLLALGTWQVQRLEWKEALIAAIEGRLAAEPVPLPRDPDPAADAFLRVALAGRIAGEPLHVLTSVKPEGPGYRVVAPFETEGRRILVDLGYIPEERKAEALRPEPRSVAVVGALHWPEGGDAFTPVPDLGRNIWFVRDIEPMAAAAGTEPLMVVAEAHDLGAWPRALRLGIDLPNNHLGYAITWFSLAAVWAVMSVLLVRRERARSAVVAGGRLR